MAMIAYNLSNGVTALAQNYKIWLAEQWTCKLILLHRNCHTCSTSFIHGYDISCHWTDITTFNNHCLSSVTGSVHPHTWHVRPQGIWSVGIQFVPCLCQLINLCKTNANQCQNYASTPHFKKTPSWDMAYPSGIEPNPHPVRRCATMVRKRPGDPNPPEHCA